MDRRVFLLGGLFLAGCATVPPSPTGATLPVTLDQAFVGRQTGVGVFTVPLTGDERRFTARLNGHLSRRGQRLTVVEDFTYDDGEANRLTWVFDRDGPGRWVGRRDDTVGQAIATEADGQVRLTYTADFAANGSVTRLGFADVIYRRADGLLVNDAVVTRLGIPIGKVRFEIRG
jgi:hypothetical protein